MSLVKVEKLYMKLTQVEKVWVQQTRMQASRLHYLLRLRYRNMSIGEIAESIGVTQQAAGKMVTAMRWEGLVTKDIDRGDKRAKVVAITPDGKNLLKSVNWNSINWD
jgi:DNA-binding MarR family transcriptional regulator